MFTQSHLTALERQCTLIALLSSNLRMSVYNSPEWHKVEKDLDEAHAELRRMFDDAKMIMQGPVDAYFRASLELDASTDNFYEQEPNNESNP